MKNHAIHKYQSGREVLEAFIPGYVRPRFTTGRAAIEPFDAESVAELRDALLSSLKSELEQLELRRPKR